jgi:hypothetical protein
MTATDDSIRRPAISRAAVHVLFGDGGSIASTVYGTVVVMATLTAAYASEKDPWKLAATVSAAVFVLWIAHVYAHAMSESLARERERFVALRSIARRELGIVLAAVLPVASLVLGAIGVFKESTAVWLALAIGLFTLTADGVRFARAESLGLFGTLVSAGLTLGLGLLVVALKVVVAH